MKDDSEIPKSAWIKQEIETFMNEIPCDECKGKRLSPVSLSVTVGDKNISEVCDMPVNKILEFMNSLSLDPKSKTIASAYLERNQEQT